MNMSAQLLLVFEDLHDEIIGFADRFKNQQKAEVYLGESVPAAQQTKLQQSQQSPTGSQSGSSVQMVAVKLKDGATITGVMKSFDPLDKIVLVIAGQETPIPMNKVENVAPGGTHTQKHRKIKGYSN